MADAPPCKARALIVACALLAYAAALLGTFVYDDVHTVRDNQAIRTLANVPRFFVDVGMFSSIDCRMYRPLVLLTYAVDWALGHGAALPFKLTNLALHCGVALALFQLLLRLGSTARGALLAACVFAAHPLASEAVNTISGRSELGVTLGLLLGLLAHLRARDDARWALATAASALLACGCKEIGVMLPALLLVVDPPRRAGLRAWLLRHLPATLAVLGYLVVRRSLFGQATAELPRLTGGDEPMAGFGRDLVTHLCTMAAVLPRALAQCVVPLGLSLDPPVRFERSPASAAVLCGALAIATLTWLALRGAASQPLRRLGVALTWLPALPWIILPLNLPYLEHRMYAPLAGLAVVLASAIAARARTASARPDARGTASARRVLAAGWLAAGVTLATLRSLEYRDPESMWGRLVATQPGSVRGLCGLAVCRIERGELHAALPLVQRAVALWPGNVAALRNLAELNLKLAPAPGSALVALVTADRLVAMAPSNPFHRLLRSRALAVAAEATGYPSWYDDAEAEALYCLQIAEPKSLVYRTAAFARTLQGDHERALALLDASIAAGLVTPPLLLDRVAGLRRLGRTAEADATLQRVLREHPFDPEVLAFVGRQAAMPP